MFYVKNWKIFLKVVKHDPSMGIICNKWPLDGSQTPFVEM